MTDLLAYLPLVSSGDVAKLRSALGHDLVHSIFPQLFKINEPDRLKKALLVVADLGLSDFVLVFDQLPEKSVTERVAIDAVMSSAEFLDMKRELEVELDDIVVETRELELCWVVRATSRRGGIPPGDAYLVDKHTMRVFQHRHVDVASLYPRYPAPETVTFAVDCPRCGSKAECMVLVAWPRALTLRVASSVTCRSCGLAQEADGSTLSAEAREAFYAQDGRWGAFLRDLGPRRLEALRGLREAVKLSPSEADERVRTGRPLLEATLAEVKSVADFLRGTGAVVELTRVA